MTTATLSLSHFDEIADTETGVKPIETLCQGKPYLQALLNRLKHLERRRVKIERWRLDKDLLMNLG